MKLYIKRDQDSGMFGGISFLLSARVELANEELDVIRKYKANKLVLLNTTHPIMGKLDYKIEDLTNGVKIKCKDISEILSSEEIIKEACRNFDILVKVMAGFGGEEMLDFNQ